MGLSNAVICRSPGKLRSFSKRSSNNYLSRYDAASLTEVFESEGYFNAKSSQIHQHNTPSNATQEFIFVVFDRTNKQVA